MAQNGSKTEKSSLTARQKRALPILASSIAEAVRLPDVGQSEHLPAKTPIDRRFAKN